MWALFLLAKFVVYLIVLIFAFHISKKYWGWVAAFILTAVLATAPWWDYYKVIKHDELCKKDGGYRVYKTVPEGVDGYFYSDSVSADFQWQLENYKYKYIEGVGSNYNRKFYRYSLNNKGELKETEILKPVSQYEWFNESLTKQLPYDLTGSRKGIRNRETGEILASITNYVLKEPWGWYFHLLGGKGCENRRKAKASLFFTEVIAAKK